MSVGSGCQPSRRTAPIDTALGLLAVLLLIAATGFFVAVEFALVAVDRDRVRLDAEAGTRGARSAAKALQAHGVATLRFNFRGVGRSEGEHRVAPRVHDDPG